MKRKCPHAVALGKRNKDVPKTMTPEAMLQRQNAAIAGGKLRTERAELRKVKLSSRRKPTRNQLLAENRTEKRIAVASGNGFAIFTAFREIRTKPKTKHPTMKTQSTQVQVPAGVLRLDGETYQHRAALSKNGWRWDAKARVWLKRTSGGGIAFRAGCRLVCGDATIYDDLRSTSPTSGWDRDAFDNL